MRIIAGRWRGRRLQLPRGRAVRPTTDRVREAWMSAMGPELPGARVVDLFAGSGALGLEAISRGARRVRLRRAGGDALAALRDNVAALGAGDEATVVVADVFRFLERPLDPFDVAFADPPYGTGDAALWSSASSHGPLCSELWLEHPWREVLPLPSASERGATATPSSPPSGSDATGMDAARPDSWLPVPRLLRPDHPRPRGHRASRSFHRPGRHRGRPHLDPQQEGSLRGRRAGRDDPTCSSTSPHRCAPSRGCWWTSPGPGRPLHLGVCGPCPTSSTSSRWHR